MWICLLNEWFVIQIPSTMVVQYSDHHLVNRQVFKPPFEYWSTIQMPDTMVPGIRRVNHLNKKQLKVCYSDVSLFRLLLFRSPLYPDLIHFHKCVLSFFFPIVAKPKVQKEEEDDVIGDYSCQHCQLTFTLRRFLKTHICPELKKASEKICQCDQCGRAFSSVSQLNRHRLGHTEERPFKCTECPKAFKTEREHKKHMTFHNGEEVQCEFCEQMCIGVYSYKLHVKRKHRYKLECEVCKREFTNRPTFRTHMRTHTNEKPFVCTECGLSFHSLSGLSNHKKNIHTDFRQVRERTHVCDLCGKGFYSKCRLKVHTESHNEIRNHLCTECGSGFKCKADLKRHMERHRTPEIPCRHCNLLFTCKSNLRKHMIRRHKHGVKVQNHVEDSM